MIISEATKLVILSFLRLQNDPKLSQASFISLLPFAMSMSNGSKCSYVLKFNVYENSLVLPSSS